MSKTQRFITDFFNAQPRHSKRLITDFFKPTKITERTYYYSPKTDYAQSHRYLMQHKPGADAIQTRGGYCYRTTNQFSEYCVYTTMDTFVINKGKKEFVKKGTKIATASIDDNSALTHITVETAYQRKGIGTELIRYINKCAPKFHVFAGTAHNSRYRLTEEGAILIQGCQQKGILDNEQVILDRVPMSPLR